MAYHTGPRGGPKTKEGREKANKALKDNSSPGNKKSPTKLTRAELAQAEMRKKFRPFEDIIPEGGLKEAFVNQLSNPNVLSSVNDIHMNNSFIQLELERMDFKNHLATWDVLEQICREDTDDPKAFMFKVCETVQEGADFPRRARRIQIHQEVNRKLKETQLKVEEREKTNMTADKAAYFVWRVTQAVTKALQDHPVLMDRILNELDVIQNGPIIFENSPA